LAVSEFRDEWLATTIEAIIGPDKLDELRASEDAVASLWETAVADGATTDEALVSALATRIGLKLADLADGDPAALEIMPEDVARRYHIFPLHATDSFLEIATANPFDLDCEKMLAFATGREIRMLLASPSAIGAKLDVSYPQGGVIDRLLEGMESDAEVTSLDGAHEDDVDDLAISAEEASQRPVVRLVDLILSEAVLSRASDIHVEPEEGGVAVRYRIDGVLRQVMKMPRAAGLPMISRLKIMASLDIADRLRPQDGRSRVGVNGVPVDLRVSTLPASLGEKVVVRILDSGQTALSLDVLGLNPEETKGVQKFLEHRHGIVLVTGPTGSGKTTTLYSAIAHIQSEGLNIVTVEDPVEYRMKGIVQVQVHERAGLTFASALRSILRQDPDVVLVGEIRDRETAQIAVEASLTGHLVLSTLHTNDAANAVTRLSDIGVESFKIGSALRGVVAQRLMRRLCSTCREPWGEGVPERLKGWIPEGVSLFRAVGCPECAMTGYRGRYCIVEVLPITQEIQRLIEAGETADRIAEQAVSEGMKSLWDSAIAHIVNGDSTLDELLRVVDMPYDEVTPRERKAKAPSDAKPPEAPPPAAEPAATVTPVDPLLASTPPPTEQRPPPSALASAFELLDHVDAAEPVPSGNAGTSVLLVDDEDQLRRVLRDLLEREGYEVFEAGDGTEALDQLDRHAPDIMVLDLNLPGMDGYNVLSNVRSRPATSDLPVIVLTARGDEDSEVRVFELGADDFLSKPFRARALSARLQAVLGRVRRK
jgi:type II secretory ATPase GspE/PulE/Tfp pilus assembly ATPase PilB-like protein